MKKLYLSSFIIILTIFGIGNSFAAQALNCQYRGEGYGKNNVCHSGEYLSALCISGEHADCKDKTGKAFYTQAYCCSESNLEISDTYVWKDGKYGQRLTCGDNQVVTGLCGSGKNADCTPTSGSGNKVWTKVRCSNISGVHFTNTQGWLGTDNPGDHTSCLRDNLITGICGSGKNKDCNDNYAEGRCSRFGYSTN